MQITCTINTQDYTLEVEPTTRALDVIRDLGITSIKEGCGEGECGACSIYYNTKLVNSCLLLSSQMDGAEIVTLEGLLSETLHIRESFEREGAVQCGFCTGGFVLRAYAYEKEKGAKDTEAIKRAFDGNICRCTGYQKIVEATLKSIK